MTSLDDSLDLVADGDESRLPWEVPEVAALAVIIAIGVVMLGGLAMGIDVASSRVGFPPSVNSLTITWTSVSLGASWAEPLLAVVLLGVVGLCWWQVEAWTDAQEEPGASGHIRRAGQLSRWALVELIATLVGAVALLVALIGIDVPSHPGQIEWSRAFGVGADALAVLVMTLAGLLILQRTSQSQGDSSA